MWKVCNKENMKDWAMKEISKRKYKNHNVESYKKITYNPFLTSARYSVSSAIRF